MKRREVQIGVDAEKLLTLFGFEDEDLEYLQITRMWVDSTRHTLNVIISSDHLDEVPPACEPPGIGIVTRVDLETPAEAFYSRYEKVENDEDNDDDHRSGRRQE